MATTGEPKISEWMAAYVADLRYEDLPDDVRALARLVLLDTIGCGLAGANTDEVSRIRRAVRAAAGGTGDTVLWGTDEHVPLPLAALANGAAVHAREIDDFGGCAHSGSVVIPAALGVAARVGAGGRELLCAIVAGYDIARRVMDGGGGYLPFKARGWHSTGTCGGFGAAAAAARLLGLDRRRIQWALGFAGSNAGGTWAFIPEGAMSKRVHPGLAAQAGVMAAYLAADGVTAPESIFEAEWGGYYPTYVGGMAKAGNAVAGLGEDFRIRLVGIKPYAACRGIHSSVDVVLGWRREQGLRADDVSRVTVRGSPTHVKQLRKQDVRTTLDAQMSLPYSIAVALLTGGAMFDQYTPDALGRPEVRALARRVDVVLADNPAVADGDEPHVEAALADGRLLKGRVEVARGDSTNPLSEDEVRAKFRTTAALVLDPARVERLEQAIIGIEDASDVRELTGLLIPAGGGRSQERGAA